MGNDALALALATVALLGSPGPAPLALAAIGANCGPRRGLSFLGGILTGAIVVMSIVAAGAAALIQNAPPILRALQVVALSYILYLAWRVWRSAPTARAEAVSPPSFIDGFIVNVTNPKAYAAISALFSVFGVTHANPAAALAITTVIVFTIIVLIDAAWLFAGAALRPLARDPVKGRWLRGSFAASMVLAAVFGVASL